MKKLYILLLILSLISLSGCDFNKLDTPDTNLEFWIDEDVTKVDFSKYQQKYTYDDIVGTESYYGSGYVPSLTKDGKQIDPEYCVIYAVAPYPEHITGRKHIVGITITDPSIEFYGITINSSFEEVELALKEHGFEYDGGKDDMSAVYNNGKYKFWFYGDRMVLTVQFNLFNIIF